MIKVVAIIIFFEKAEAPGVWILCLVDNIVRFVKVYLIIVANNLAL